MESNEKLKVQYSLEVVPKKEQQIASLQIALLWIGAGLGLAAIFSGNTLAGLGLKNGLLTIIVGMLVGSVPMYFMSRIGTREGVSGMIATRASFGIRGSFFPSLCNALQLIGWTAVMILMAAEACVSLKFAGILGNRDFWIILIGLITTVNALLKHNHLKWFQIFTVGATLILSIIMTYAVLSTVNVADLMDKKPKGHLTFSLGLDYVIGMCLSWVPLVADYSRYARNINGAAHATYWGYALSSIWMYFVGLLCTIATGLWNASPIPIMGALGLGIPGLLIIFFSTVTTAFLDVFSAGVSASNLFPKFSERRLVFIAGVSGTLISLVFPIDKYQSFLLILGAVFIPIESIVLVDYFLIRKHLKLADLTKPEGSYWYRGGVNLVAFVAFVVGFALYEVSYFQAWPIGSSFISLIITAVLYYFLMRLLHRDQFSKVRSSGIYKNHAAG